MKLQYGTLLVFCVLGLFFIIIATRSYTFYRISQDAFTEMTLNEQKQSLQPLKYDNIDFYVITMKTPERMENIELQKKKLKEQGTPIHIEYIDAVVGKELNLNELIKQDILSSTYDGNGDFESNFRKGEIGCYMSHIKTYNTIQQKQNRRNGYSVVFEDDFSISSNQFMKELIKSIEVFNKKEIDIDMMYVGTIYNNHGTLIEYPVHNIDKNGSLFGTHAIMYKNSNINNIIELLKPIDKPIDVKLQDLNFNDKVKGYVMYPHPVTQNSGNMKSTIVVEGFFKNILNFSPI